MCWAQVPEDHPLQLTLALGYLRWFVHSPSSSLPYFVRLEELAHAIQLYLWRRETGTGLLDCRYLRDLGIYFKHVVVSDVGVFHYPLYSGLETLDLCSMNFKSIEESSTSARTFFKSVLPQLIHSLQVLKIQPKQEGRWCFDPDDDFQSIALCQCNKLRSLSVSLNSTSSMQVIIFRPWLCSPSVQRQSWWYGMSCWSHLSVPHVTKS